MFSCCTIITKFFYCLYCQCYNNTDDKDYNYYPVCNNYHYSNYTLVNMNTELKSIYNNITENYNPYENKNTLFKNVYKDTWNLAITKNINNSQKLFGQYEIHEKYKINYQHITHFIKENTLPIENIFIPNYKINDQYSALGIKINEIKKGNYNTKYIVASLFDANINKISNPHKNIEHYCICLYQSIKLFLDYLPDYNIRIYGDKSINLEHNNNKHLQNLFNFINNNNRIDYFEIEQSFNDILLHCHLNYVGLFGTIYRYYILLDPNVTHMIFIDAS